MSTSAKVAPVTSHVCHWLTPILYPLGRRFVLPFYFRQLKVTGQENIPKTGPVILAPTHRSRWDALLIPYAAGQTLPLGVTSGLWFQRMKLKEYKAGSSGAWEDFLLIPDIQELAVFVTVLNCSAMAKVGHIS
jgi:hypothetical protein